MKLNQESQDIIKVGESQSKQAGISQEDIGKLQYMLTKGLYSDPITAVIAEVTNNGVDSVVQSGKNPAENPVWVELGNNGTSYFFKVTDNGVGLSRDEFENILMNYLKSTKENDDTQIGMYGIGAKSFLSLDRAAIFTCRKDGIECKYLAYQGGKFCEYDLLHEKPTTEPNGVIFELPINGYSEYLSFVAKAKQKLAYYDTVALIIDNNMQTSEILRSEDWQYSAQCKDIYIHVCLKDVYYTIDWVKLGIASIHLPIALRFGLKDGLSVTPSREQLIYTEKVKDLIKMKIADVADWFVDKYNEVTPDTVDSIIDVWDDIGKYDKCVTVNSVEFKINPLINYSTKTPKELAVKGISLHPLSWYKGKALDLLSEYNVVTTKKHYDFSSARYDLKQVVLNDSARNVTIKIILVKSNPLGYLRRYFEDTYNGQHCVFITKYRKRGLWDQYVGYYPMLGLASIPRVNWKKNVQEFARVEKEFKDKIIDATKIEDTQAYKDWVEAYKVQIKRAQVPGKTNYKALNKQADEMTISIARNIRKGYNAPVFEKSTVKISRLSSSPFQYVICKDKEQAEIYWSAVASSATLKFCIIGSKEINKLPLFKTKKFLKFEEFMSRDCKPFQRIASNLLFQKLLEDVDIIRNSNSGIFTEILKVHEEDYKTLKAYVNAAYVRTYDDKITSAILEAAEEKDLFDKQLWDVYIRLKNSIKHLDFLTCMKEPNSWDIETVSKYKKVVNQMLLFQKKYYDLEGYELVKKPDTTPIPQEDEDFGVDIEQEEKELEEAIEAHIAKSYIPILA